MDSDQLSTRQRVKDLEEKVEWLEGFLKGHQDDLEKVIGRCSDIERQALSDFTRINGVLEHVWRPDPWMTAGLTLTALGAIGSSALVLFMIFTR